MKKSVLLLLIFISLTSLSLSQRLDIGASYFLQISNLKYNSLDFFVPENDYTYSLFKNEIENEKPYYSFSFSAFLDFGRINIGIETLSYNTKYNYHYWIYKDQYNQEIDFTTVRSVCLYELSLGYTHYTSKPRCAYLEGGISKCKNSAEDFSALDNILYKSDNYGYFAGIGIRSRNNTPLIKNVKSNYLVKARFYKNLMNFEGLNSYSIMLYLQVRYTVFDFRKHNFKKNK